MEADSNTYSLSDCYTRANGYADSTGDTKPDADCHSNVDSDTIPDHGTFGNSHTRARTDCN